MLPSLAPNAAPSRARLARRVTFGAVALVVATSLYGFWPLLVNDPMQPPLVHVAYVERDGDYVAWVGVFGAAGRHVGQASYAANGTVDRVLIMPAGELDLLLAGREPPSAVALEGPDSPPGFPKAMGRVEFAPPAPDCPPPTGGCREETVPVLVWVSGDAWKGMPRADAKVSEVWLDEDGSGSRSNGDGPVHVTLNFVSRETVAALRVSLLGFAVGGLVSLAAALVWLLAERRAATAAPARAAMPVPSGAGTADMLGLVRLTGLYVDGIRRGFVVSAFAIVLISALSIGFLLPPLLDAMTRAFRYSDANRQEMYVAYFCLLAAYFVLMAMLTWLVSYLRVRRELKRWAALAARFEKEAGDILGA